MTEPKRTYETERTHRFRAGDTNLGDASTISNIERFGLSVWHIKEHDQDRTYFSYTQGLFDTTGYPELIVVGLLMDTAHVLLNESAQLLRKGVDVTQGRHAELLGEVECEFRPVASKWIKHLMHKTVRYYEDVDFPVLQVIYPDLENRFPGEEGFNEYFAQPLLQPDAPETERDQDFWASNDPGSSLFDWKFADPPHTRVFLSETANSGTEPITYVSHDIEDGAWQFLGDLMDAGGGPVISCFHHPIDKDPTLKELADLPLGWCAERTKPGEPWVRRELPPEENSDEDDDLQTT
jgi:hypothetical protein